jgi:hypothetical protein
MVEHQANNWKIGHSARSPAGGRMKKPGAVSRRKPDLRGSNNKKPTSGKPGIGARITIFNFPISAKRRGCQ